MHSQSVACRYLQYVHAICTVHSKRKPFRVAYCRVGLLQRQTYVDVMPLSLAVAPWGCMHLQLPPGSRISVVSLGAFWLPTAEVVPEPRDALGPACPFWPLPGIAYQHHELSRSLHFQALAGATSSDAKTRTKSVSTLQGVHCIHTFSEPTKSFLDKNVTASPTHVTTAFSSPSVSLPLAQGRVSVFLRPRPLLFEVH